MKTELKWLATLLAMFVASTAAAKDRYLKAFPPAADGMVRFVINLPHKERGEDDNFKVEITVGKKMLTDGVNRILLGGEIKAKPLEGWGFTCYEREKFGAAASTLIGVPPDAPKVEKFVTVPSITIGYNSRIPLVIYVPEGGEVRYRMWKAADTFEAAEKG